MNSLFRFGKSKSKSVKGVSGSRNGPLQELPEPFFRTQDIASVHDFFALRSQETGEIPESTVRLGGQCFVCETDVDFDVEPAPEGGLINWRETLICPNCKLINRWRGCLHLFEAVCKPTEQSRIYLTETLSPVYQYLAGRFPLLSASEYLPQAVPGSLVQMHGMPVRNEDVTQLSFDNACFESVLCFDVLEHVPDYRAALREFFRVLTANGQLLISVPFSFRQETLVRAELDGDGNIRHHVEPCYHGDPLSEQGVLSFYDFGMELLDEMKTAGFQETFLVCYCSRRWGYLHQNVAFVGRKI